MTVAFSVPRECTVAFPSLQNLYVLVESWLKAMKLQLALTWLPLELRLEPTFRSLIQNWVEREREITEPVRKVHTE